MLLLIDAGNSRLKYQFYEKQGQGWQAATELVSCVHEQASNELQQAKEERAPKQVLVSSVASETVGHIIKSVFGSAVSYARVSAKACGLINAYESQNTLGVDRWVAAIGVAAKKHYKGHNRIVVDAGTAVTVDLINADNEYCGGVIMPGAAMLHGALVGNTAGVRASRQEISSVIGRTTQECVNAGVKYGLSGAIERVIQQIVGEVGTNKPWQGFFSGGDAQWLCKLVETNLSMQQTNNLIFDGLLRLYDSGELD